MNGGDSGARLTPCSRRVLASRPAGQQPQGPLVPPSAAGVPRPRAALLARSATVVRVVLRTMLSGAPLSIVRQYIEQQNRPVQGRARPLAGLPARPWSSGRSLSGDAARSRSTARTAGDSRRRCGVPGSDVPGSDAPSGGVLPGADRRPQRDSGAAHQRLQREALHHQADHDHQSRRTWTSSRSGSGAPSAAAIGIDGAPASGTTPRAPAHTTTAGACHDGRRTPLRHCATAACEAGEALLGEPFAPLRGALRSGSDDVPAHHRRRDGRETAQIRRGPPQPARRA